MHTNQSREIDETTPALSSKRLHGRAMAVPTLLLLLGATACGNGQLASSNLAADDIISPTATAAATPRAIAMTQCETEDEQTAHGAAIFICTQNAKGGLVWLEASAVKALKDKRAADAAAKAAAAKAAAAKDAAEKAAAKAAAQKSAKQAAAKKAAEAAAAAQATKRAAEAKAAQEAAAAQAAEDQAAADEAAQQTLVAPPAPPAAAPSGCDPNYSGACVPVASDVDCAGGSGNGPAYVQGPVTVTGSDVYGLDRNQDGVACEG
jgi:hypothetical protein